MRKVDFVNNTEGGGFLFFFFELCSLATFVVEFRSNLV